MIAKAQALQLRQAYINSLPDRIDAAIVQAATFGGSTIVVNYAPASDAAANTLMATAIAAGWSTTTVDTVNKTITIAP